ncbi:hypothetical protein LMG33818_002549 [Halomonadaceae bacterium LMG 33818]|uniref:phage baseplate assembly protein V n=1 Tax=Cernens ardua TaxID=3402176 RepID=UPI003EDC6299
MNTTPPIELLRLIMNLVRIGQVAQCDFSQAPPRVRVQCGELLTNWLPWNAGRAGALRVWAPPAVGETVILLSPSGDTAGAVVIGSLYNTAMPAPEASKSVVALHFSDGARLHYDQAARVLTANIPGRVSGNMATFVIENIMTE